MKIIQMLHFRLRQWTGMDGEIYPKFDESILQRMSERGLTQRAIHALSRGNIHSMEQLLVTTKPDLLRIKECGKRTTQELLEFRDPNRKDSRQQQPEAHD